MKRFVVFILSLSLAIAACTHSRKDMLVGKWYAVKLENPEMDSFFASSKIYIDTVGKGNADSTNIRLYGVANMDSMRVILHKQYDSAKALQDAAVTNTVFDFRKGGMVVLSFNGAVDSSRWYIDNAGLLVMDKVKGVGAGEIVKMEILNLADTVLKLKFAENNTTSTVTFRKTP